MGGEVGGKIMVYNTRLKKYNSKNEEFSIFDYITRACPKILFVLVHAQLFPFNTIF